MAKLTEEAKEMIGGLGSATVVTVSSNGKPHIALKEPFRVLDDEHVYYAEFGSPHMMVDLRDNPQTVAIVFDPSTRKGCRIWGEAECIDQGNLYYTLLEESAKDNKVIRWVVKISVEELATF